MAPSKSIFEQLKVDNAQKQKLETLDKKQMELSQKDKEALNDYEANLQQMLNGKQEVKVDSLTKLDSGIERGRKFKGEISDLASSLTMELQDLGQFFGDMNQYKGFWEKTCAKFGFTTQADKSRLNRVKSSDVKENLQTILDYGNHMVQKLYSATLENMECLTRIDSTIKLTGEKLQENQPVYEEWRGKRERIEREKAALEEQLQKADANEFSKLEGQKSELDKQYQEARVNEQHYFTIVDKAKQALPVQRTHAKAYGDIIESLVLLRTGLEQNIENVTQLYLATPTAIKTALGAKAASQYDKGMKYATDKATETVLASAAGMLDESAKRAERPLIEPEKLELYRKAQKEMEAAFKDSCEAMSKRYSTPQTPAQQ